jgi:tetratricopeptide (TPR) repeat protein
MKRLFVAASLLACLVLSGAEARAQTGTARGKVLDEQGQPLQDVKVELEFLGGVTRKFETKTNKKGEFTQVGLPGGNYSVTASKEGFQPATVQGRISLGDPTYLPEIKLRTKAAAQAAAAAQADKGIEEARATFKKAIELSQAGKLDEAEAAYKELLVKNPSIPEVHYNLGHLYSQKKDWASAEASFLKALELRTDYSEAKVGLIRVYQDSGQQQKAMEYMSAGGDDPRVAFNLGITFLNQGKSEEAIAALEKAEKLDPSNVEVHYHLGTLLVGQNKIPEAIARLEKYLSLSPQNQQNIATAQGLLQALKPKK